MVRLESVAGKVMRSWWRGWIDGVRGVYGGGALVLG